jgi:hypothetical protein
MSGRQLCNAAQALRRKGKLNRLHILLGHMSKITAEYE